MQFLIKPPPVLRPAVLCRPRHLLPLGGQWKVVGDKTHMQNVLKIRDSELYFFHSGEKFISDLEGRCDVIA